MVRSDPDFMLRNCLSNFISFSSWFILNHSCMIFYSSFRGCFHSNPDPLSGGLFLCCGQLVLRNHGPRHSKCQGLNLSYKVRGLFYELEFCLHRKCSCKFTDPQSNILHQEAVHRSILTWACPICKISFVSEGYSDHHLINSHNSPTGYVWDLDEHYRFHQPPSFSF